MHTHGETARRALWVAAVACAALGGAPAPAADIVSFTGYSAWTNGTIAAALPPAWDAPGVADTHADGASVTCRLLQAGADVWAVWAEADQGTSALASWTAAPGGGALALGAFNVLDVVAGRLSGLPADQARVFRFYGTNAVGSAWSAAGSFVTDLTAAQAPVIASAVGALRNVAVAWESRASHATGALVQWYSPADPTTTVAVAASPFVHAPVAAGQVYAYRVGSTNAANGSFSGYSAWTNATAPALASALLAYDLFSGVNAGDVTLDGQAYTTPDVAGFDGAWVRHGGNARTARNFNADAGVGPQPIGSNGAQGGAWDSNVGWARECYCTRRLAPAAYVDLGRDGTHYLSFYGWAGGDSAVSAGLATGRAADSRFFNAGLIWNNATSIGGAVGDANDKFYIGQGVLSGGVNDGLYGVRTFGDKAVDKESQLFFVMRIQARATGDDTVDLAVYDAAHPPESGPESAAWVTTYRFASADVFTHLVFGFNGSGGFTFDGFRLGTEWTAVAGTLATPSPIRALGFNFVGNTSTVSLVAGYSPGVLATNELAGAPGCVQACWNSLQTDTSGGGGAPATLVDSLGATVATTVEYDAANTYGTRIGGWAANNRLMRGYIDDNPGTGNLPYLVIRNIPYARYRLVLYADNDTGVGITYGGYWVETPEGVPLTSSVYLRSPYGCFAGAFLPVTTASTAKGTAAYGNLVVFDGLTARDIRVRGRYEGDTRAILNAVQVIDANAVGAGTVLIVR